jgi:hypothetical protein
MPDQTNVTYIHKEFDQMPVPHGVLKISTDKPQFKVLSALFRTEEDALDFIALKNGVNDDTLEAFFDGTS